MKNPFESIAAERLLKSIECAHGSAIFIKCLTAQKSAAEETCKIGYDIKAEFPHAKPGVARGVQGRNAEVATIYKSI